MNKEEMLKTVYDLEMNLDLAIIIPPFGKYVNAKTLKPTIEKLKEMKNEQIEKIINEMEAIVEFGFMLPLLGKFINTRELQPKIEELKIEINNEHWKQKEVFSSVEVIKETISEEETVK